MNKALAISFLLAVGSLAQAAPLQEITANTYPLGPNAEISIRNTDGTIYLYGSEVNELKVYVRKKAYSKERLAALAANVSIQGDKVNIETVFPPRPEGLSVQDRSGTVDYVIILPQTATLSRVELVSGEIIVSGLRGSAVNVRLTNGIVRAEDCFSALQVTLQQGALDVAYNWWEPDHASLQVDLTNGNMRVALPPAPSIQLDAATVNGQVMNQFGQERGQADQRSVRTTIGAEGGAQFKLRTVNGNIQIDREY